MDYVKLKQLLLAAFDHFLSCHDAHELEQMMQGLEAGKKLVIQFPEAINREDYDDVLAREEQIKDDVLACEERIKDDVIALETPKPRRVTSRIKRKKTNSSQKTIKELLCEVPIYMELSSLSKKQQDEVKNLIQKNPTVTIQQPMIVGNKVLAMAAFQLEKKAIIRIEKPQAAGQRIEAAESSEYRDALIKQIKDLMVKQRKQGKPP